MEIQFIPLTFIQEKGDIQKQIENTSIFSVLQKKYPVTTLGDYLESTQYWYTASALEAGNCHMLRITDINNGRVDWNKVPFCNCDTLEKYRLRQNDILVARTGWTTWKSFLVEDISVDAVFACYLIRLRPKKDIVPDFLYAFLNSYLFWSQITEMKGWSAQPNVNAEKLKTVKIPKCDVETQKLVVKMIGDLREAPTEFQNAILWARKFFEIIYETQIEHMNQSELLVSLRSAILREAVQGKLVPQDPSEWNAQDLLDQIQKERDQSVGGKRSKNSEIKSIDPKEILFAIPENWVWCRLSDISTIIWWGTPSSSRSDYYSANWIPWLTPADMRNAGKYIERGGRDISEIWYKNSSAQLMPEWSVVFSSRAPIWYVAITKNPLTTNQGFKSLIPHIKEMNEYLYYFLSFASKGIDEAAGGTTFKEVSWKEMARVLIPLPPLAEQNRITSKINQLIEKLQEFKLNISESKDLSERLLKVGLKEVFNW